MDLSFECEKLMWKCLKSAFFIAACTGCFLCLQNVVGSNEKMEYLFIIFVYIYMLATMLLYTVDVKQYLMLQNIHVGGSLTSVRSVGEVVR